MCELFKQGCVPVAWNSVLYQLVASTEMVRIIDAEIQLMEREHACEFMQSDCELVEGKGNGILLMESISSLLPSTQTQNRFR
jgi:hypothetical protein